MGLERGRGGVPLYWQLAALLEESITRDDLRPGDLLPSDNELVAEHGVSRATVTKALDSLVERGIVTRRQGRGTFVSNPPMERRLPELTGFSEHLRGLGFRPGHQLLSFDEATAHADNPVLAPFSEGAAVVVLHRLRTVEGKPAGLHRTAVPTDVAQRIGLTERAMSSREASLYALMEAGGVILAEAQESLRAVNAERADARVLDVPIGSALIEVTRLSRDEAGRLVEVVQARYLGSMYVYRIDLARPTPNPTSSTGVQIGASQDPGRGARSLGLTTGQRVRR